MSAITNPPPGAEVAVGHSAASGSIENPPPDQTAESANMSDRAGGLDTHGNPDPAGFAGGADAQTGGPAGNPPPELALTTPGARSSDGQTVGLANPSLSAPDQTPPPDGPSTKPAAKGRGTRSRTAAKKSAK